MATTHERGERAGGPKVNANIGRRLRELRIERGLAQADVARKLGVSAAYVNLIEKGKRAVQLPLLWKALELYGVELEPFMASLGEARLEDSLARLLDEPLLRSLNISEEDLHALSGEPKAASTITALFNLYKNARGQLDQLLMALRRAERDAGEEHALRRELAGPATVASAEDDARESRSIADALAGARFDYSPFDEIVDFLEANDNYFPALEEFAERLRKDCGWGRRVLSDQISQALTEHYGVKVQIHPGGRDGSVIRRYESDKGILSLSADMLEHRRKFQLAHTIGLRILDDAPRRLHDELSARFAPRHAETPKLIKIDLANYFAGALLLPYEDFHRETTRTRYDVERLSDIFELPYETIAHRVVTLADPRNKGLPMHLVRSDIAGNISKRYAGRTGLRFPVGAGSCPRWAVHMAFLTPSVMTRQYSIFPDGGTFFCFAKVVVQPVEGNVMRGTAYSIGLGTHADAAKHLVYAADMPAPESLDLERSAIPVGVSCRFCERTDCAQRAAPSYKFAFSVDEYTKKDNVFSPLLGREHDLIPLTQEGRPMKRSADDGARTRKIGRALEKVRAGCDVAARRAADPVDVVHRYADPRDKEIVALLAACVAFGNVKTIRAKLDDALARLGPRPSSTADDELDVFARMHGWVHRVFLGEDAARLLIGARRVQRANGTLGDRFVRDLEETGTLRDALARFCDAIRQAGGLATTKTKRRGPAHILPDPHGSGGSKRLMLFLRWMIRPDDGVDLGLWKVSPSVLLMPVDTHIHKLAKNLGFTKRKDVSWQTAEEITASLRRFDPGDPVKYDFSLCHLGMLQRCPSRKDAKRCEGCGVKPVCRHWA